MLFAVSFSLDASKPQRQMTFAGIHLFDVASNEDLYLDMLVHCDNFISETKGLSASKEVKDFVSLVKKSHKSDAYAWIGQTFQFVEKLQMEYPPVEASVYEPSSDAIVRKNIMLLLDFPMHCDEMSSAADENVKARYPHERDLHYFTTHEKLVEWLLQPAPAEGEISIAKVYSSGFLFRTHSHMLALDVRWQGSEDVATAGICKMADLFLLTHNHGDHYSLNVLERMMLMGKPVVLPNNNFHETCIANMLSSYEGENKYVWNGPIGTVYEETQIGPAKVQAVMAAQGDEPCLLYMVEMDGWRIAAVGDNSHHEYQPCYEKWEAPDFFCTPIFQGCQVIMSEIAKAPHPSGRTPVYLPHHENECHHGVSHRVGYRFLYHHPGAFGAENFQHFTPYVLLDGGESVTYKR